MDARAPQDDPQSPGLTPSLAKPETGKEAGRRKARPQEKRVKRVRATRRGSREAPASSRGTKEDERQPATARPAARRRRSNPATPAAPTKGNHPGEAQVRRDRRKDPHRRERDPPEGPHEEAETQRKAPRRGKNPASSEDTCPEKERVRSKATPRKAGAGPKRRREPSRRRSGRRPARRGSTEKEAPHPPGPKGRHQHPDQRPNRNRAPRAAPTAAGTEGEEDQTARPLATV